MFFCTGKKKCADGVNWLKGEIQLVLVLIWVSETSPSPLVLHSGEKRNIEVQTSPKP